MTDSGINVIWCSFNEALAQALQQICSFFINCEAAFQEISRQYQVSLPQCPRYYYAKKTSLRPALPFLISYSSQPRQREDERQLLFPVQTFAASQGKKGGQHKITKRKGGHIQTLTAHRQEASENKWILYKMITLASSKWNSAERPYIDEIKMRKQAWALGALALQASTW